MSVESFEELMKDKRVSDMLVPPISRFTLCRIRSSNEFIQSMAITTVELME